MKNIDNIDNILFPGNGKIVINKKEQTASAVIVDAEIDPIECTFNNDNCITLNTESYTYLTLTVDNLELMLDLIEESNNYYNQIK